MHEEAVPHVDADVAEVVEEDEVAGLQRAAGNLPAVRELLARLVREIKPTWANTQRVKPEQSKPALGDIPPQR